MDVQSSSSSVSARYKAVSIMWYLVTVWTVMDILMGHIQLCQLSHP